MSALTENEKNSLGSSYRINFFGDNYSFSTADKTAMENTQTTTANEILWTSKVDASGVELTNAKTVFPAGDLTFFGKKTIVKDMTMKFMGQHSIYADGKTLVISTGVNVSVGTKPDLYGGSNTKKVNKTDLTVKSGAFAAVYGGENGYGADETSVVIGGDPETASIYGGSRNAETGKTKTEITVPNTTTESAFSFGTVSGFGTDATDVLTKNVTGTAEVALKQATPTIGCTTTVENLSGFTKLDIGDVSGAFDHQKFEVTGLTVMWRMAPQPDPTM